MKTIEERADKYLMSQGLVRGACAGQIAYGARCMYDGYLQGDADRKAIDIDTACKWVCKDCDRCVADADKIARCPRLEMFRKAMEE